MARKKKLQSTGELDSAIGKGPSADYVAFVKQQQQQKQQKAATQKQQQVQKQKLQQQKQEANKPINKAKSIFGKVLGIGKEVAKGATAGEQKLATGIARTLPGGTADIEAQQKQATQQAKNLKFIKQQQKAGKISDVQAAKITKNIATEAGQTAKQQAQTIKEMPTKKQIALGAASTAADIVTGGALPEIKAASLGVKGAKAANIAKEAAGLGTASALNAAAAGGNKKQVAENTALGAIIPGASKLAGKTVEKVGSEVRATLAQRQKTQNILEKLASQQEAKKPVVAELPTEAELPQPKITEPPKQTEIPKRPVEQISQDIKTNNEHIRTITGKSPHDLVANAKEKPIPKEVQPYIKQHEELQKEYVDATTPAQIKATEQPKVSAPVTTPTTGKTSKIAKSVESRAIEKGLTQKFGDLTGYTPIQIKDQAEKAATLIQDRPRLDRILSGQEDLPKGLKSTALVDAAERHAHATNDVELLQQVARSPHIGESSASAQELRLARERAPNSPVQALIKVSDARKKALEKQLKKTGTSVSKKINQEAQKAKVTARKAMPDITKTDWNAFVDSIKC